MNKSFYTYMSIQNKGRNRNIVACLVAIFLFASCQSYKKVPYLQDTEVMERTVLQENLYDAKIMPKDLLTIVVSCTNPELAIPFNLTVASNAGIAVSTSSYVTTQPVLQPYLVDNEGNINFPVLGELKLGGLTKREAEQLIIDKLKPYMKETPIVTVRMVNYKISVIGEVTRPGTFTISNEKPYCLDNSCNNFTLPSLFLAKVKSCPTITFLTFSLSNNISFTKSYPDILVIYSSNGILIT